MLDHDTFVEFIHDHFDNAQIKGDEVKINDLWWEDEFGNKDTKNHCWVNTTKGCFRAFKSGKTGHILEVVMELEKCSWEEAQALFGEGSSLLSLEKRLDKFFEEAEPIVIKSSLVQLPPKTYLLTALSSENPARRIAERYLVDRKLDIAELMVCLEGPYKNRIIIPYYGRNKELIYFNSRYIGDKNTKLRYLGPDKEMFNVGKGDVIFLHNWKINKLYLTEGEFDAMSLCQCGLEAGACGGKSLSPQQIEMLRPYSVTVAFDNDTAGKDCFFVCDDLHNSGIKKVGYVRPPNGFKDWNKFLVECSEAVVNQYVTQQERSFSPDTINSLRFKI